MCTTIEYQLSSVVFVQCDNDYEILYVNDRAIRNVIFRICIEFSCTQIRQLKDFIQTNWYSHSIFSSAHPFRSRSQIMRTISWYNLVFRSDLCVVVVIAKGIYIYVYYLHIVKTINPNHFAFRFLGWDTLFGTIDIINDCCDRNADV